MYYLIRVWYTLLFISNILDYLIQEDFFFRNLIFFLYMKIICSFHSKYKFFYFMQNYILISFSLDL